MYCYFIDGNNIMSIYKSCIKFNLLCSFGDCKKNKINNNNNAGSGLVHSDRNNILLRYDVAQIRI